MLTIDIHSHILPEKMPRFAKKFGYNGFIHLEHHASCRARMMVGTTFFREIESNCWDATRRIHEYNEQNVQVQVISTVPVMFNYWAKAHDTLAISQYLNDHIAQVVRLHPKHFIGLGTLPMQNIEMAIREMERCINELGLAGIEIGTHINNVNLNDPRLFSFFEAAQELGAAVFVHPWEMLGRDRMQQYWMPWLVGMPAETALAICSMIFGGIFEKLPNLRVAFAHGGGSFFTTFGRIQHGFEARPDLVAIDNPIHPQNYMGKFYVDSLVHDPRILNLLIETIGANHVALGTDYPFPLGETEPKKLIQSLNYDEQTMQWLTHGSALKWLNLKKQQFDI